MPAAYCLPNHLGFSAIIMNGTLAPAPLAIDGSFFFPFSCGAVSGALLLPPVRLLWQNLGSTKPIRAILCYFRLSSHLFCQALTQKDKKSHLNRYLL